MKTLIALSLLSLFSINTASAQTATLKGVLKGGGGYTIALLHKDGSSKMQKVGASGAFSFKGVKRPSLKDASLQIVGRDGQFYGPVVLGKKGRKLSISFSGKGGGKILDVGKITLKEGYGIGKLSDRTLYTPPNVEMGETGGPIGAGKAGLTQGAHHLYTAAVTTSGGDQDRDGIVDAFDADDNGNGILDPADPASKGADIPYVSLHFDFRRTLNANVRTGLSAEVIDAVVAGENVFNSTFFISLPHESSVDSAYLVCGESLSYCRPHSPVGYSSGVMESSDRFRAPMSALLNSAGFPTMERISSNGHSAVVLSLQPRVGRDTFRAGDLYRVVLTSGGRDLSSRTFTLPPYFVSVPALKEYTVGGVRTSVDYNSVTPTSGGIAGVSPSDPIVLDPDGRVTLTFWRPQREPIGEESGYQDYGSLNYGVVIDEAQATCGGFYSNVSGDLVEGASLGEEGSPFAYRGANLTPLVDQQRDRAAGSDNLLTFTVDLKNCLARGGGARGTYRVTLTAAGAELTGGRNSANQLFYVQIP